MNIRSSFHDRSGLRTISAHFAVLVAACLWCSTTIAADGNLDPTFGSSGFTLAGITDAGYELPAKPVVLANGKILICSNFASGGSSGSDFFIARFNANGSLDNSFNFDGKVTIDFDSRDDGCNALAVQSDGKIIAVGTSTDATSNSDFGITRLNADGSLDSTFGAGTGEAIIPFDLGGNNGDVAGAVAIQSDGNIVVAGWAGTAAAGDDFAVVRLLPDGTRDTSFNLTGRVTVGFDFVGTNMSDAADAVVIDDAGRIIVGGVAAVTASNSSDFALIRLLPNGQLDHNFDADGRATLGFDLGAANDDVSYQTILQSDGKILMVGKADTGSGATSNNDFAAARLLPDGSPDPDFGAGGKVVAPFDLLANGNDVATGVVEDSVGRIVMSGVAANDMSSNTHPAVARLLADGTLDGNFGAFGKKTFNFGGTTELLTGITLQGTQIIVAGLTTSGSNIDNLVARLEVDLIFANGFE